MEEAVRVILMVVVVVVMSGSATVVHVNKLERQRQDSHHQYSVCHSNCRLAMRMLMHT